MAQPENPPEIPWKNDVDPTVLSRFNELFMFANDHGLLPPEGTYNMSVNPTTEGTTYVLEKITSTDDIISSILSLEVPLDQTKEPKLEIVVGAYSLKGVGNSVLPSLVSEEGIGIKLQFRLDDMTSVVSTSIEFMQEYQELIKHSMEWKGWIKDGVEMVRLEREIGFTGPSVFATNFLFEGKQTDLASVKFDREQLNYHMQAIPYAQFSSKGILAFAGELASGNVHAWIEAERGSFTSVLQRFFSPPNRATMI